jgi:c-di-GMP-binding flagellar brake protein YcgR
MYSYKTYVNHFITERKHNNMDKRKFTRFRPQDDAYAALRGNFAKVGKIYDISLNGLAFRYLAEKVPDEKFTHVDIFLTNNGFHLSGVHCTVVYDAKESINNQHSVSPYRCGLKFDRVNAEQQRKVELFINNYTTGVLLSERT